MSATAMDYESSNDFGFSVFVESTWNEAEDLEALQLFHSDWKYSQLTKLFNIDKHKVWSVFAFEDDEDFFNEAQPAA